MKVAGSSPVVRSLGGSRSRHFARCRGRVVRQWTANPCTPVRFRSAPPSLHCDASGRLAQRESASLTWMPESQWLTGLLGYSTVKLNVAWGLVGYGLGFCPKSGPEECVRKRSWRNPTRTQPEPNRLSYVLKSRSTPKDSPPVPRCCILTIEREGTRGLLSGHSEWVVDEVTFLTLCHPSFLRV